MRAVVVVHYRTPDLLERCLEQIGRTWNRRPDDRIVVVDNSAPVDSSSEPAGSLNVERLCAGNLGYAGAVNLARRRFRPTAMVVMNPDVLPQEACLVAFRIGRLGCGGGKVAGRSRGKDHRHVFTQCGRDGEVGGGHLDLRFGHGCLRRIG